MEIKNKKTESVKLIAYALFAIIILCVVFGCGSRKVNKSKTVTNETVKTENTKVDTSKTTTVVNSNIKILDSGESEEFTITPIDSSKEMVVNSVKYKNAVLKHKKQKHNTAVDKSENIVKTEHKAVKENSKSESNKSVVAEMKVTDKKQFNFLSLWWIPLLLIVVYWLWRKYRSAMPF